MKVIGWQSENTCKLIFSLAGKNRGVYKYMFTVQRVGRPTKSWEKVARKIHPLGASGSFELNINSGLCFGINSQHAHDIRIGVNQNKFWHMGEKFCHLRILDSLLVPVSFKMMLALGGKVTGRIQSMCFNHFIQ